MTKQPFDTLEEALEILQDIPLPDPDRRARFRADLLDRVDVLRAQRAAHTITETVPAQSMLSQWMSRLPLARRLNPMLAIFLAVIVAIAGGLGGMVFASNSAVPGDALYGVDRTVENIQYGLSGTEGRSTLALRFAQERSDEVNTLIEEGDDSDELLVSLDEAIAAIQALLDDPTLSDVARTAIQAQLDYLNELRVQLDPSTLVELEIETEDGTVQVDVDTEDTPDSSADDSPAGDEQEFVGTLDSTDGQTWVIDGVAYPLASGGEVKGTLVAGDLVKVHLITLSDGTVAIREIELAESDDQNEDEGDDDGAEFEIVGTLDSVSGDTYVIDGVAYTLGANAEVKGSPVPGDMVKVHLVTLADGTTVIREIEPLSSSDDDNSGEDHSGSGSDDDNSGSSSSDNSGSSSDDDEHDDNSGSSIDDDEHDDDNSGSGSHDDEHDDD